MSHFIELNLHTPDEWAAMLRKLEESLVTVGQLFGDEERLLRAKARRVCQSLRATTWDLSPVSFTTALPRGLNPDGRKLVNDALQTAAVQAFEVALMRCVSAWMDSIHERCTCLRELNDTH
jgi:hypothetical protein